MRWPTKTYGHRFARQIVRNGDNMVGGWNLFPRQNLAVDESGNGDDGTIIEATYARGLLGDGMYFNGASSEIDVGNTGESIRTVAFWVKPTTTTEYFVDLDGGTTYIWANAGTVTATGFTAPTIYVDGVADTTIIAGKWHFIVVTDSTAETVTALRLGRVAGGIGYMEGLMTAPRVFSDEKSAAWVTAEYEKGANAIGFKTEWGVRESVANETAGFVGVNSSPFEIISGTWQINNEVIDGKLCKIIECVAAGVIAVPTNVFEGDPTEHAYGTWEFWISKADASVLYVGFISTDQTVGANGYNFRCNADESVVIEEAGVGNVVTGGTVSATAWNRCKVTRRYDGLFEGFIDGTSFGTGTDTTVGTSDYLVIDADAGDKIAYSGLRGNHAITKSQGVV